MPSEKDALRALLRSELYPFIRKTFDELNPASDFVENWHIKALAWHLERFAQKEITRLIVTLPPRNLKSISASVALPAWLLGRQPSARIVCASYAENLAVKFGRNTERVMKSGWYREAFSSIKVDRATDREIEMSAGGGRYATSVGGALTGLGGEYIIIDDPIKASDAMSEAERHKVIEWYRNTVYSRLNNKSEDCILLVMQRVHSDDLAGFLMEQGGWTVLNLPAIAEEEEEIRISADQLHYRKIGELLNPKFENESVLDESKRNLGSAAFAAQYQQQPVPPGGNMILREWFKTYDHAKPRESFELIVQSWDTAIATGSANSYSVCMTFGIRENRYYLVDIIRERMKFPELKARVVHHARVWEANHILIEKAASGYQLLEMLMHETKLPLIAVPVGVDKETRVSRVSSYIEAGRVFIPDEAGWLAEFLKEILAFPLGKFDDQVDALSHFLFWAQGRDHKPPAPRVYLLGGGGIRDGYRERTGHSGLPNGW